MNAHAIVQEAEASLEVLADLVDQGALPSIEASDFKESLERIKSLAAKEETK